MFDEIKRLNKIRKLAFNKAEELRDEMEQSQDTEEAIQIKEEFDKEMKRYDEADTKVRLLELENKEGAKKATSIGNNSFTTSTTLPKWRGLDGKEVEIWDKNTTFSKPKGDPDFRKIFHEIAYGGVGDEERTLSSSGSGAYLIPTDLSKTVFDSLRNVNQVIQAGVAVRYK